MSFKSQFFRIYLQYVDKVQHLIGGTCICLFAVLYGEYILMWSLDISTIIGILSTFFIGIGFEFFSKVTGKGVYDFYDIIWTIAGIPVALILRCILI